MRILDNLIYRAEKFEDPKAAYELGVIFETGDRVKPNPEKAREWLEKAADMGHEDAARRLGRLQGKPLKLREQKKAETEEEVPPVVRQPPVIEEPQDDWSFDWAHETSEPPIPEGQPTIPQPSGPVSWMAVAGFVLGILGFITNGITSIPAVLFGYYAKNKLEQPGPRHAVDPFLTQFGLILGYAGVALNFQYLIYLIFSMFGR